MQDIIFTELIPVDTDSLPKLFAYHLIIGENNSAKKIGGKLSYRLRQHFPGNWVWSNSKLISDAEQSEEAFQKALESLWRREPDPFTHLYKITPYPAWQSTPKEIADFFSNGILADFRKQTQAILQTEEKDLGPAYVERNCDLRGWAVGDEPAISLSISSNLIYKKDLKAYAATLQDPQELLGIWVLVKEQDFKGEIVNVVGLMKDHRQRLLATSSDKRMQLFLQNAPENEWVVKIRHGQNYYDYPVSALKVVLMTGYLSKFGVDSKKALNAFRIAPKHRFEMIRELRTRLCELHGIEGKFYSSRHYPERFLRGEDVEFTPKIQVGNNQTCSDKEVFQYLQKYGLYKRRTETISMGVIDARRPPIPETNFGKQIREILSTLGVRLKFVGQEQVMTLSRVSIEKSINRLQEKKPDVIVAIFPDFKENDEEGDDWFYGHFKSLTIGRNIAGQVIDHSTLNTQYALWNVALGILGKTGNIPFVLADPLPYADLVVGIDIARERKQNLAGSMNVAATARIYFNNGELLQYAIHDAPLEGETIPDTVLHSLFPADTFAGKRVVIHRDGPFRGNEKQALHRLAEELGATFYLVEIRKSGAPRIYRAIYHEQQQKGSEMDIQQPEKGSKMDIQQPEKGSKIDIQQPEKGTAFKLNAREALLVSSLPPFRTATPQPLYIRTEAPFTIEQAIHSVLSLTLLHYGSQIQPKLPVTVHYSDRIGYLALHGIKPKDLEGNIPFWL